MAVIKSGTYQTSEGIDSTKVAPSNIIFLVMRTEEMTGTTSWTELIWYLLQMTFSSFSLSIYTKDIIINRAAKRLGPS